MPSSIQKLPIRVEKSFFYQARKIRSPFFLLYWQKNPDQVVRLAITVPKKSVALSSQRNKIKRKLKPVFQDKLTSLSSGDFFVVGFSKVLQLSFAELNQEVEKVLSYVSSS